MRKVNSVTKPIFFPLPLLEEVFHTMAENNLTMFSVIDMTSGFWQIKCRIIKIYFTVSLKSQTITGIYQTLFNQNCELTQNRN